MYERSKFLVPGCTHPLDSDLEAFYETARRACSSADLGDFNMLLARQGLVCDASTPIAFETFEILYSA
jgi:hypothetical protein